MQTRIAEPHALVFLIQQIGVECANLHSEQFPEDVGAAGLGTSLGVPLSEHVDTIAPGNHLR